MDVMDEWLHGKKRLTAVEVRKLPIGTKVQLHGADRHGDHTVLDCVITQSGKHRVLSYTDYYGSRMTKRIQDYPGKAYTVNE